MKKYVDNFMQYRFLLSELVKKGIKLKYRRSYLGMIWSMLEPLLTMIVLTIVFGTLYGNTDRTFPVYILTGRLLYSFFSQSTKAALKSIRQNSAMIKKVYVPKYLFVISRVFSSFINLMASFTALLLVMMAMRSELHWTVMLSPIPLMLLVLFSLGVGMILSAVTVKFRDIMHLYSVFLTALTYLTPVIYPMSILPGWLYKIVMLNPLTNILMMFRDVMINNMVFSIGQLIVAVVETVVFLIIGFYVFYRNQDQFILNI